MFLLKSFLAIMLAFACVYFLELKREKRDWDAIVGVFCGSLFLSFVLVLWLFSLF